jgi:Fe-Mn family superoxide dismutase
MKFTLPKLEYDYEDLEPYIDKETMKIHHSKHHAGYVKKLNEAVSKNKKLQDISLEELLKNIDSIDSSKKSVIKNNGGGHFNHSLFWKVMTPKGKKPHGKIDNFIKNTFGSINSFKEKFTEAALNQFGSGWAWLIIKNGNLSIVSTLNQDSPITEGSVPLLGIDVWEHAYYLKYKNKRLDYINAWWNVINWQQVEKNFRETLA